VVEGDDGRILQGLRELNNVAAKAQKPDQKDTCADDLASRLERAWGVPALASLLRGQKDERKKLEEQKEKLREELDEAKKHSSRTHGERQDERQKAQEKVKHAQEQLRLAVELFRLRKSLLDLAANVPRSVSVERKLPRLLELNEALDKLSLKLQQPQANLGRVGEEVDSLAQQVADLGKEGPEAPPKPPADAPPKKEPEELVQAREKVRFYKAAVKAGVGLAADKHKMDAEDLLKKVTAKEYEKEVQRLKEELGTR
jgi:hypothetical protein